MSLHDPIPSSTSSSSSHALRITARPCCACLSRNNGFPGPDGPGSLCQSCHTLHRKKKLRIYRGFNGRLTARERVGGQVVRVISFPRLSPHEPDYIHPKVMDVIRLDCLDLDTFENECYACGELKAAKYAGPDGANTLCIACFSRYRRLKLRLYGWNGKVTSKPISKASLLLHVGFSRLISGKLDFKQPKVREATGYNEIGMLNGTRVCLNCRLQTKQLSTGPDGYKTLCGPCAGRYYRMDLCVYVNTFDNRVSVLKGRRQSKRAIVVDFEKQENGSGMYDVRFPIVESAKAGQHAKFHCGNGDECGQRVPRVYVIEDEEDNNKKSERKCQKRSYIEIDNNNNRDENKQSNESRRNIKPRDESLSFVIKAECSYGWETRNRYIYMAYGIKMQSFKVILRETFGLRINFSVCYKDCEGDLIHISDDIDMAPMFALARSIPQAVQIVLRPP